jgi:Protein of unknown function (DUF1501)
LDTYDPKPGAPAEIRGEFRAISTKVPGIRLCEHFPLQARMLDKLAVVRSVVSSGDEHSDSMVMTGYPFEDREPIPELLRPPIIAPIKGLPGDGTSRSRSLGLH